MDRDRTVQLVRQGYPWAARLRGGRPAVPTRVLGRRAVVVGGPEGVRRFYDPRLQRRGAFPAPVKLVLFGPGTVHGLDDEEHHARKALLLEVLRPAAVAELDRTTEQAWQEAVQRWPGREVVLFDEAVRVLGTSVLRWAGVPDDGGLVPRARQLATVVHGFAKPGPAYARAVTARVALARWAGDLVRRVRSGELPAPGGSALAVAARMPDRDGRLLPVQVAATELLNVVRPTVAASWFVAFAGAALHEHPAWRQRAADGDHDVLLALAQEVRRLYPFVPVLTARTRTEQDVLGVPLPAGGMVVLDVWGTLHDPAHWEDPHAFRPERFLGRAVDPDLLVPQGGGSVPTGHRCPGEDVVLRAVTTALRVLAPLPTTAPAQDLGHDLGEVPTLPRSRVVLATPA